MTRWPFRELDWQHLNDEEFELCPPILTIGGDGAMLDIGFQNLSRLLASGKPIRVLVLDTQVYSNTGGQACTSGLHRAGRRHELPAERHTTARRRLARNSRCIAIAHRGAFVHQSSQALGLAPHAGGRDGD